MPASFNRPSVVVGVCPHTSRLRGFVRNVVPVERPSTRQPRAWPALLAHVECLRGTREFGLTLPDSWRESSAPIRITRTRNDC